MRHLRFYRGPQRGDGHGGGCGPGEICPVAGLAQKRLHDGGQRAMLCVVQMIRLGRSKENFLHLLAKQDRAQPTAVAGPECAQNIGHGLAERVKRLRPGMDRPQRINQHDLAINAAEMVAKEGFHDFGLIGLKAPLKLAVERISWLCVGCWQRGEG